MHKQGRLLISCPHLRGPERPRNNSLRPAVLAPPWAGLNGRAMGHPRVPPGSAPNPSSPCACSRNICGCKRGKERKRGQRAEDLYETFRVSFPLLQLPPERRCALLCPALPGLGRGAGGMCPRGAGRPRSRGSGDGRLCRSGVSGRGLSAFSVGFPAPSPQLGIAVPRGGIASPPQRGWDRPSRGALDDWGCRARGRAEAGAGGRARGWPPRGVPIPGRCSQLGQGLFSSAPASPGQGRAGSPSRCHRAAASDPRPLPRGFARAPT